MFDFDAAFLVALARSLIQAVLVGGIAFVLGWPSGVGAGLWEFPARRALIQLIAVPLLLPSFLVAIGLSLLWRGFGGLAATVWAFACVGVPLVFFATLAAIRTVTHGQADAARLAGGEALLFRLALRATAPIAALAAILAGVFTLADMGPGQIFGWHGAASELLISFAVRYDIRHATGQALMLAIVAAVCAWPAIWHFAPDVATGLFPRDTLRLTRQSQRKAGIVLFVLHACIVGLPLVGLFRTLFGHSVPLVRAWSEVMRTWFDTVLYAVASATVAVLAGFALAALTLRSPARQRAVVAAALALFALPPVLFALWLIPWSSRFTVCVALALRCLPITLLFGLCAFGAMPQSWRDAAAVHRVPGSIFAVRVTGPWLARWAIPAGLLSALIATAEIAVVLMLHPPGHATLPLAIFTVMANAPEALVGALCMIYVGLAVAPGALIAVLRHSE